MLFPEPTCNTWEKATVRVRVRVMKYFVCNINLDYWLSTSTVHKYVIFSLLGVCEGGDTLGTISNNNNDSNKNVRKA